MVRDITLYRAPTFLLMEECKTITLEQLLASRDMRRAMQQHLQEMYPDSTLMVLTIVMPGSCKQTRSAAIVAEVATAAIESRFANSIKHQLIRDLCTGFEAYYLLSVSPDEAKRAALDIETSHPLGRLMDIDVIGAGCVPLSRFDYDTSLRQCLVCGRPARECMRSAAHPLKMVMAVIDEMTDKYLQDR